MEILTNTEVLKFDEFVALLDGNKSARFVSLVYKAKETGELARHTILLNVNRARALKVDLANLEAKRGSLTGLDLQAAGELIASLKASIAGYNPLYTKHGYYAAAGNGNVQVSVLDKAYIRGYSVKKDVLVKGTYKEVKSKPLTIAKDNLRKEFKSGKCREYIVTPANFKSARHDGKTIVVDATGSADTTLSGITGPAVEVNQPLSVPVS
jgi:hypothetical protein